MTINRFLSIAVLLFIMVQTKAQYSWNTVRLGGGGSVPGMIAHPKVKDLFYIRTDVGNCYRWDAENGKWIGLLNGVKISEWWRGTAADIAIDPSDFTGNILYATVGKYDWAGSGQVWKSTDRGNTWSFLNLNVAAKSNGDQWVGQRLAVDPFNSNVILLTTTSNGTKRTDNGGESWSSVSAINGAFLVFDSIKKHTVYIGHSGGIKISTNDGLTFTDMAGAPLECHRVSMHSSGVMYVTSSKGVYKWNGSVWSVITPATASYGAIAVNPQNSNQVIVSKEGAKHNLDMYRSNDGGSNWVKINRVRDVSENPWAPGWHFASATNEFCWDPFDPNHVWFTDWYNAWETNDPWASTVTWKTRTIGHEEIVTIGALACPPTGNIILHSGVADVGGFDHLSITDSPTENIWAKGSISLISTTGVAFQETNPSFIARVGREGWNGNASGCFSTNGGTTYTEFPNKPGPGGRIAVSANSTKMVWATQGGKVFHSHNNGSSWIPCVGLPASLVGGDNIFSYAQPLAADKVNGNIFYAFNWNNVYKSTDGGINFSVVNSTLPGTGNTEYINLVTVPGQEGVLYLGLNSKGLRRSTDGGSNWTVLKAVSTARLLAVGKALSANPAVYIYGTVNNVDGIFRSDDNGETWTELSTPEYQISMEPNIMAADRNAAGRVFIGTNGNGIYVGVPDSSVIPKIVGKDKIVPGESGEKYKLSAFFNSWTAHWSTKAQGVLVDNPDSLAVTVNWGCTADSLFCDLNQGNKVVRIALAVTLTDFVIKSPLFVEPDAQKIELSTQYSSNAKYIWTLPAGASVNGDSDTSTVNINWGKTSDTVKLSVESFCETASVSKNVYVNGRYPYPDPAERHILPGKIESDEFDYGGEGVAYHDLETVNQGSGNRSSDGVDTEFNDGGGNIGWTEPGEWLTYSITVDNPGKYFAELRVASAGTGGTLDILINNESRFGKVKVPGTGSWSRFNSIYPGKFDLLQTDSILKYVCITSGYNIGRLIVVPAEYTPPTVPVEASKTILLNSATLKWFHASDNDVVSGYIVYLNGDSIKTITDTTFVYKSLQINTLYEYKIITIDRQGNRSDAMTGSFTILPLSVDNSLNNIDIEIFPNPFTNEITIRGATKSHTIIEFYNILGNIIYKQALSTSPEQKISVSAINSGLYFVQIRNNEQRFITIISKQ